MIMSSQKQTLTVVALVAFLLLTACRKTSTANETASVTPADGQERLHPDSGAASVVETRFFEGSIGNALDLQMKLVREGERLSGSYFYQKVGTRIDLRGSIDKDGNLTLEEFDP